MARFHFLVLPLPLVFQLNLLPLKTEVQGVVEMPHYEMGQLLKTLISHQFFKTGHSQHGVVHCGDSFINVVILEPVWYTCSASMHCY